MNVRIQTYGSSSPPFSFPTLAQDHGLPAASSGEKERFFFALQSKGSGANHREAEGTTVYEALEKGFDDLMDLCDVVMEEFTGSRDGFAARQRA